MKLVLFFVTDVKGNNTRSSSKKICFKNVIFCFKNLLICYINLQSSLNGFCNFDVNEQFFLN